MTLFAQVMRKKPNSPSKQEGGVVWWQGRAEVAHGRRSGGGRVARWWSGSGFRRAQEAVGKHRERLTRESTGGEGGGGESTSGGGKGANGAGAARATIVGAGAGRPMGVEGRRVTRSRGPEAGASTTAGSRGPTGGRGPL
ncbi:uncharacterized protein LOC131858054 [Cryptomeria japonica]|uniref:uncharacterized protein LOC131858054 n=1 Tax=Cryptomeria japonica TaxID=3369 RepID=UPI0027D9DAED|nr:uncharacterized protein LOC131858054 [Cryptomeria japonica]